MQPSGSEEQMTVMAETKCAERWAATMQTHHPSFFLYSHVLGFFPRCRPPEWDSVQVILADLTPSESSIVLEKVGYSRQCR